MSFIQDTSLVFPSMTQVNLDTGRVYRIDTGEYAGDVLPSITRILGHAEKPGLEAWKKSVGPKKAELVKLRAQARGNGLHQAAEAFLSNSEMPTIWPHVAELWQHLRPWLADHITRVYAQERDVYSFKLGVAGRFDLLADVDGVFSIVDFKQADKPKKMEYVQDYILQGTFYSCAVYELTGRRVEQIVLPITSPEGVELWTAAPGRVYFNTLRARIEDFYKSYETPMLTVDTPVVS